MQIQQKGVGFDANFKPESEDFDIGDPTMLIVMLRDKLYSDKLRVFIQEYISNARDANREAGQPDHNLDITAPSRSEPIFKVRDFGPGLSPDRMRKVFIKFGHSTKRHTNGLIGGYGIGAKSGWAYTDSFVVKSFHEGTEYHYLCHLGETPKGSMSKLHEGPTTEPNGVEIQVQIQLEDIPRAASLINFLTCMWPELPRLHNVKPFQAKTTVEESLPFETYTNEHYMGVDFPDLMVAVDGVPYGFKCSYLSSLLTNIRGRTKIFRVSTGEIEVAANREQIEIDDKYKKWLSEKIYEVIRCFQAEQLAQARKGLASYVKFWIERGRLIQLQRERQARNDQGIDYDKIRKTEKETMESVYELIVRRNPETIPWLQELGLIVHVGVEQSPIPPSFPRLTGFAWYFDEEKVLLVNDRLFPVDMRGLQVFARRREQISTRWGERSRSRKELFQLPYELWQGYSVERDQMERGLHLKNFEITSDYNKHSHVLFNDEKKEPEKLKRLTSRIATTFWRILELQEVPEWMQRLGVEPLSKHLTPIYRSPVARVSRPAGSVRQIKWSGDSHSFQFGSFNNPSEFTGRKDAYFVSNFCIYAHTDEPRKDWEKQMQPHVGRMNLNGWTFMQGNKKGIKALETAMPKVRFAHWEEWAKTEELNDKNCTQLEYEQFALSWFDSTHRETFHLLTDASKVRVPKITNEKYRELIKELQAALEVRGGRYSSGNVGTYFYNNRKKIKSLDKSRIYQLRQEIIKKFPLLLLVEIEAVNRKISPVHGMLNEYMENPKAYMRNRVKQHGNAKDWLQSEK